MRRRILIIILIVVLVWAGVWYFYVRPKQNTGTAIPTIVTSFFPKSSLNNTDTGTDTPTGSTAANKPAPALRQLTARPVAGYTLFSLTSTVSVPSSDPKMPTSTQVIVDHYIRYVSRLNGYVYEIKNTDIATQISNIFVPNIYEALFADNNNTAILRFLRQDNRTIASYSVPIPALNPDNTRTQKAGTYLPDNISALAVSSDQSHIIRVINNKNNTAITTSTSTGIGTKPVITSDFQEWLPQWTKNNIFLQTKAASVANGFLYTVDSATNRLRRIVGDVPGMTTSVSPSGTYVLYSESTATGFTTKLFNTKTNAINTINLSILPEKCTWLQNEDLICAGNTSIPNATYPDAWYSGTVHFSDQLYQITTASNVYTALYDGSTKSLDMTDLQADEGQRLIYFIDKNTGLLWTYKY